jgi:uncharacterized membrane protein
MQEKTPEPTDLKDKTLRIELFIARLLRWGVIISFAIIALGLAVMAVTRQTGYSQIRLDDVNSIIRFRTQPDFPNTLSDVGSGVVTLKPYAIIALGSMVLIAIPVLRVIVSILAFAVEGDWLYVGITAIVLAVLLLSFTLGEAAG